MRRHPALDERPIHWMASSKKDLLLMPRIVVREIGLALGIAQHGGRHPTVKPWRGEGPGVLEIVSDFNGNAFRALYTVRFPKAIYVLHCFQKKSPRGRKTARTDISLIRDRLRAARSNYEVRYGEESR